MRMIYFGAHDPSAPLSMPMVLLQLHNTLPVFHNDY